MSKVKIKTKNVHVFGKKITLPIDGETKVSKDGTLKVSEDCAKLLSGHKNYIVDIEDEDFDEDLDNVDSNIDNDDNLDNDDGDGDEDEGDEDDDSEDEEEDEEEEDEEEEDEEIDLNDLELPELIKLAKEAGIKEPSYRSVKNNKKKMVKFLSKRLED